MQIGDGLESPGLTMHVWCSFDLSAVFKGYELDKLSLFLNPVINQISSVESVGKTDILGGVLGNTLARRLYIFSSCARTSSTDPFRPLPASRGLKPPHYLASGSGLCSRYR